MCNVIWVAAKYYFAATHILVFACLACLPPERLKTPAGKNPIKLLTN
jgi:hypothetical protein